MKYLIACALLLGNSLAFACSQVKDGSVSTNNSNNIVAVTIPSQNLPQAQAHKKLIQNLLSRINSFGTTPSNLTSESLKEFLAANSVFKVNGTVVASDIQQLVTRTKEINKQRTFKIVFPVDNLIVVGDLATITYTINIKQGDQMSTDKVTAFIKFEGNKIKSWDAVIVHA